MLHNFINPSLITHQKKQVKDIKLCKILQDINDKLFVAGRVFTNWSQNHRLNSSLIATYDAC